MSGRPSLHTFRSHIALTAALVTLTFAVAAAFLIFVPLTAHLGSGEFDPDTLGAIARYFLHLHQSFWPVVIGAVFASIASGVVLFGRMRSPLIRFVAVYEQLRAGRRPEPVRLRAHDYLHEEAEALNRLLESLDQRAGDCRRNLDAIEQALCELGFAELEPKSAAALAEAREAAQQLRRSLIDGR